MPIAPGNQDSPWNHKHFLLVLFLLAALIVSEALVFGLVGADSRKDVLALMLGTFGAWIGAGAAYFFGRENLRTATESMLKMRGRSPEEILANTRLSDMKPKPIPKKFKKDEKIEDLLTWFEEDKARFFAVVVDEADKFEYAVSEEALYRFMHDEIKTGQSHDVVCGKTLDEVIKRFQGDKDLQSLIQAAVKMSENYTAVSASDMMDNERKFVTIVVDVKGCPTGYITTGDIRRLILSTSS